MKTFIRHSALVTTLALFGGSAHALDFKTSLRTVQLPTTAQRKITPVARPSVPGTMSIAGQLYCGDADVEHFVAQQGGNFDVVNGDTEVITYSADHMSYDIDISTTQQPLYTTIGYWVVRDGEEPLPTKDNFNTVSWGYMSVTPDGNSTMDLTFPASRASDGRPDALQMLRKEVTKTHSLTSKAFGHTRDYRVFMGVFACINPMNQEAQVAKPVVPSSLSEDDYRPSHADINYSLAQQPAADVLSETSRSDRWSSESTALSSIDSWDSVNITKASSNAVAILDSASAFPISFRVDRSGEAPFPSEIKNKIRAIVQIPYPTFTAYEAARTAAGDAARAVSQITQQLSEAERDIRQPNGSLWRELESAIAAFNTAKDARDASAAANGGTASTETQTAYDQALAAKDAKQASYDARLADVNRLRSEESTARATELAARTEEQRQRALRPQVYASQVGPALNAILPTSIALASNKITACRNFGLNANADDKVYRWEHFPMNASCRVFFQGGTDLATVYNDLAAPVNHIEPAEFLARKKNLVQNLYLAGAYEASQAYMQATSAYKITNTHCFRTNGTRAYIDRLIASYPILMNYDATNRRYILDNTPTHLHPEPLFALRNGLSTYALQAQETQIFVPDGGSTTATYDDGEGGTVTYTVPSGSMQTIPAGPNPRANLNAVFCQIYGDGCNPLTQVNDWKRAGILLPLGDSARALQHQIDSNTFAPALNINFRVRGLSREGRACRGVVFC